MRFYIKAAAVGLLSLGVGMMAGRAVVNSIDETFPKHLTQEEINTEVANQMERIQGERRYNMATVQMLILVNPTDPEQSVRGSAVHLGKGYFLSAQHVCVALNEGRGLIKAYDNNLYQIESAIMTNPGKHGSDLCLFKADLKGQFLPALKVESNRMADQLFKEVYMPGYQGGMFYSIVGGKTFKELVIDVIMQDSDGAPAQISMTQLMINPSIRGGHSGAAVIDRQNGRVIGIVSTQAPQLDETGAVPLRYIHLFLCDPSNELAAEVRKGAIKCDQ